MIIKQLSLQNFRNFAKKVFEFSPNTTVLVGPNGAGKTNVLEALFLLSTGKSFRADVEREMIKDGQEIARVGVKVIGQEDLSLEVMVVNTSESRGKRLLVNGVGRRYVDFAGNLRCVLFGPWDLDLISGSPSGRRRFLNFVLCGVDREYRRSLVSYEKGLRQRNRVLERIREGGANRAQLTFWDRLLTREGDYISTARGKFVDFANNTPLLGKEQFLIEYDKSGISQGRLEEYAREEVLAAATLVGPHRDDVKFKVQSEKLKIEEGGRDLATYGSRGEQRMGILWLKLAELAFVEQISGEKPVLLLDDIFSELDDKHRGVVMSVVGDQQTIVTTADPHTVEGWQSQAETIEL